MTALTVPRAGSQNARILEALRSGRWVSVSEIHRRAGYSRLNSRISELRSYGYDIEHTERDRPGKRATLRHGYTWHDAPALPPAVDGLPGENVAPRDDEEQFRIYRMLNDKLDLLATATDPESVGVAIYTLGQEGEFDGYCLGLLHTPDPSKPGRWIVSPFDAVTY